ncbi:MAG TPA: HAMP domain-containing sensor histidine kinase [Chitinophagaceae bacterium]|nr:HAMP domain-containing sensor histidine kinase [Chitinophagaceae bacterium]
MKTTFRHIFFSRYSLLVLSIITFALSFVFNSYYTRVSAINHERRSLTRYIQKNELNFNEVIKDTHLLRKLVQNKETLDEFKSLEEKEYGIYVVAESIFGTQQMLFWSNQNIIPPIDSYNLDDGEYFKLLKNGYYVVVKRSFAINGMSNRLWTYALIPIKSKYYIESQFLNDEFAYSKTAHKRIIISSNKTDYPIKSSSGQVLFYIERRPTSAIPNNDPITVILRVLSLCFFFVFAHSLAEFIAQRRNNQWRGVVALVVVLIVFRLSLYFYPLVFEFRQFELFDPAVYGTNVVNRTLGDLLINSLLFSWITVFAWSKLGNRMDLLRKVKGAGKWIIATLALLVLVVSTFILASTISSLVADSKISFDVTDFFSLNKYSVIGFIVLASLSLGYYHFTQIMFRFILPVFERRKAFIYFGIGVTGLAYLTFRFSDPAVQFYLPVLLWLIGYTWLVSQRGFVINRFHINVAGIIFWIFIFSVSISAIIIKENKTKEWSTRKTIADNLAIQDDESNEMLLKIALTYLDNRFLASNFYRFHDEENGRIFRDSILTANYKGYVNKFDTKLYVFEVVEDSTFNPLFNDDELTYESLNNIITQQSKQSRTIPDLYSYVSGNNKITYITKKVVQAPDGKTIGVLFIVSNPKTNAANALEATLFREPNENDPRSSPNYSFAIYKNNNLVESSSKYAFATTLTNDQIPKQEVEKRKNGDFSEMWYRNSTEKVIVLARKVDSIIEAITLFSYIFCAFLFLVTFIQTIAFLLRIGTDRKGLGNFFQMNIRTQVHSTIIFISILSFLIIAASTISFFITRYNRNNADKLSRTLKVMENEMKKRIAEHSIFDDVTKIYEPGSNRELKKLVSDVADIHNVDVNVYDLQGNLQVSSQENIYEKGVLSKQINPEAFYHLSSLREVERVQQENISDLTYLSIYAPVRSDDGTEYAYVNIPYFLSQFELHQEISNFLVTIIILNAFIFLTAGVIALFITNRITRSFSIIGEKMREVNLGKMNEEIIWNRNDEIGELVKEYNKMVSKLGESAAVLARSEREGAWREMARQVAHEIKNPLTPMKLSIQYLQKAILNNSPDVKELTAKVANTLVEQIDHLSKIAFDFSQFANIGNTQVELFDMHEVIKSLKELYQRGQQVEINWDALPDKVMLRADKTQMNRLFTNLFQNAVEACEKEQCVINVNELRENGCIVVSVKDNGEGIPFSMQSKIFAPNFTTKSSGTGLGLAMCKSIVEQAHGKIWFETELGEGTTFHIELPLAN